MAAGGHQGMDPHSLSDAEPAASVRPPLCAAVPAVALMPIEQGATADTDNYRTEMVLHPAEPLPAYVDVATGKRWVRSTDMQQHGVGSGHVSLRRYSETGRLSWGVRINGVRHYLLEEVEAFRAKHPRRKHKRAGDSDALAAARPAAAPKRQRAPKAAKPQVDLLARGRKNGARKATQARAVRSKTISPVVDRAAQQLTLDECRAMLAVEQAIMEMPEPDPVMHIVHRVSDQDWLSPADLLLAHKGNFGLWSRLLAAGIFRDRLHYAAAARHLGAPAPVLLDAPRVWWWPAVVTWCATRHTLTRPQLIDLPHFADVVDLCAAGVIVRHDDLIELVQRYDFPLPARARPLRWSIPAITGWAGLRSHAGLLHEIIVHKGAPPG